MGRAGTCVGARISEQTLYRWRAKYGGMQVNDVCRYRYLEEENRKLKQLLAEATLDNQALRELQSKKMVIRRGGWCTVWHG